LGQTPQTAFPVCAVDTFKQTSVPICGNTNLFTGCNDNAGYQNKNPYWYKFTCYVSGTLGFQINPNTQSDDYDWQLYDVTNITDLNTVFTNPALTVCNNWSSNSSSTGTSSSATSFTNCAGPTYPNQSKMPNLIAGHEYLLLISHFTNTQDGYSLYFGGGTASLKDTTTLGIKTAEAFCDGERIIVALTKRFTCSSLAADGSDFTISPLSANIISATSPQCANGFDMDTVILTLDNPLPVNNYQLSSKTGTDGNTLLDNCGSQLPAGLSISLPLLPVTATDMDSITPPTDCKPVSFDLVFSKNMLCNSIAANGSDFVITGPQAVTIKSAIPKNCSPNIIGEQVTTIITITIDTLFAGGIYTITLKQGADGNSLINECYKETPAGESLQFYVKQSVSAAFAYNTVIGCRSDTVYFQHNGSGNVNQWTWNLDKASSTLQNPVGFYTTFGNKNIKLIVSNSECSDSSTQILVLNNEPYKAMFTAPTYVCPEDFGNFKDSSIGTITAWQWNFGNGDIVNQKTPAPEKFLPPTFATIQSYTISLIIQTQMGCYDTATQTISVPRSCYIAVPSAFTPNGDGLNDYLYPLNAYKAINLEFKVINRYGQVVFQTTDWTKKWDGYFNGIAQSSGTYVWYLNYTDMDTKQRFKTKGTTVLIR
jgi:gliding motility-associated-like protein